MVASMKLSAESSSQNSFHNFITIQLIDSFLSTPNEMQEKILQKCKCFCMHTSSFKF
jgi:hypothetical protein